MRRTAVPIALVALVALALAGCGSKKASADKITSPSDRIVVGYYADWDRYARGFPIYLPLSANASKLMLDARHLTYINYAFAKIVDDFTAGPNKTLVHHYKVAQVDDMTDPLNFKDLRKLKKQFPNVKALISIGGWTLSDMFSPAINSDDRRQSIAKSAVDYMRQNGFDGIDIDWEFPVCCGSETGKRYLDLNQANEPRYSPDDKHNLTLWMKELRKQLDELGKQTGKHYPLTMAASAAPNIAKKAYEFEDLGKILDWVNLMAYDYHGVWEKTSGHTSPMRDNPADPTKGKGFDVEDTVKLWEDEGVPPAKLVLGVPFYGHGWDRCPATNHGMFQRCKSGSLTSGTWYDLDKTAYGSWDYWDLKKNYLDNPKSGFKRYWDSVAQVPYLYNAKTGQTISYDDAQSIAIKGRWIASHGLKGGMFWEAALDKGYPLQKTFYDAVMGSASESASAAAK